MKYKLLTGTIFCELDGEVAPYFLHVIAMEDKYRIVSHWCEFPDHPDVLGAVRYVDVPLDALQVTDGISDPMELCGCIPPECKWVEATSEDYVFSFHKGEFAEMPDSLR